MPDEMRVPVSDEHGEHEMQLDAPLDSPALKRLIDEVRSEEIDVSRSYNRTYNRHNR